MFIDKKSETPIFQQIYKYLVQNMVDGSLKKGDFLPGTRTLAQDLSVSRNSVDRAYQQLEIEGYLNSVSNVGFQVRDDFTTLKNKSISEKSSMIETKPQYMADFSYGSTNFVDFPISKWQKYSLEVLEGQIEDHLDAKGSLELRTALNHYLSRHRGVDADVEQIIITNGHTFSLNIICDILKSKSDSITVAMEDPGFPVSRNILKKHGNVLPLDYENGIINLPRNSDVPINALLITPSHHFPTGGLMQMPMRLELLDWAQQRNAFIIEDDYDSEFRYVGDPVPSLQSIATHDNVIYLGTFSKPLSSSLRMSYLILPKQLVPLYDLYFGNQTSMVSTLQQAILTKFLDNHDYEKHIRIMNKEYKKRYRFLVSQCKDIFRDQVTVRDNQGGLFVILDLNSHKTSDELVALANQKNVKVYPTTDFYQDNRHCSTVFLGLSQSSEATVIKGLLALKDAWSIT